jgi:poly(A) polymerase
MHVSTTEPKEFATQVVRRLTDAGHRAVFAGGCVRDMLLGASPQDYMTLRLLPGPNRFRRCFRVLLPLVPHLA